ncbi:MAG: hypothetical protein DBY25_04220 [Clostridiales bacterium]|nr:MAG: hypothetical protein DBY25_04220 [Clostridiales bacterium]
MKQQPKAAVLMSTFNGALYVQAQVESIMNQTYSNLCLYIRDDGSTAFHPVGFFSCCCSKGILSAPTA